jgi:hypothetical protein
MQCGKMFTYSYDCKGSPLMYMTPSKNNTDPSPRQVKNTMFVIERAVDLMVAGVEWVVGFWSLFFPVITQHAEAMETDERVL